MPESLLPCCTFKHLSTLLDWEWVVHNLDGKGNRIRTLLGHVCYLMRPYLKSPHTTPQKKLKQNIQSNNSNKKGEKKSLVLLWLLKWWYKLHFKQHTVEQAFPSFPKRFPRRKNANSCYSSGPAKQLLQRAYCTQTLFLNAPSSLFILPMATITKGSIKQII